MNDKALPAGQLVTDQTADKATNRTASEKPPISAGQVAIALDLQTFLPYRMYRLAAQMSQAGNKLSALLIETGVPIGEREWRIISVLGSYGGLTNSHVAEALRTDAATVTRGVKVLKELGFVATRNSKKDRRKVLIYLTQKGADFHDQITPKRLETGAQIEACFSADEKEQLNHLLNKLDRHLYHLENEMEDEWE